MCFKCGETNVLKIRGGRGSKGECPGERLSVYCLNHNQVYTVPACGQQCPTHWYGYMPTSKCYRVVKETTMTWDDARTYCQIHGGDLVRIDSASERVGHCVDCCFRCSIIEWLTWDFIV